MHNRKLIDIFFAKNNIKINPIMQTDSIFSLLLTVYTGQLSTILSGPTANFAKINGELEIRELVGPAETTAIGIMIPAGNRLSIVQNAAKTFSKSQGWKKILNDISIP
jgi:hypothetical protein